MKKRFIILLFCLITSVAFAQNASTYFPAATGYKWYYKNIPLDSLNNPVTALTRYRVDSFSVVGSYKGLNASIVRIKDNLLSFNQNTSYNDTNYHNFQTTNGWEYLKTSMISDTIPLPGLINFFRGLENWYSMYRFAQAVNSEYVVLQKDTTIAIDTIQAPIRVKLRVKRLNDETVSTVNGNYLSKKFVTISGLYLRVLIFEYPIIERPDTTWIAQNVWMVKKVAPSTNVNLAPIGIPLTFSVPGNIYELANPSIGIQNISTEIPSSFSLKQNYPNPFNAETVIRYAVKSQGNVSLKLYSTEGKEITSLYEGFQNAGTYELKYNAASLPSGVYFYNLKVNGYSQTRRMVMTK